MLLLHRVGDLWEPHEQQRLVKLIRAFLDETLDVGLQGFNHAPAPLITNAVSDSAAGAKFVAAARILTPLQRDRRRRSGLPPSKGLLSMSAGADCSSMLASERVDCGRRLLSRLPKHLLACCAGVGRATPKRAWSKLRKRAVAQFPRAPRHAARAAESPIVLQRLAG